MNRRRWYAKPHVQLVMRDLLLAANAAVYARDNHAPWVVVGLTGVWCFVAWVDYVSGRSVDTPKTSACDMCREQHETLTGCEVTLPGDEKWSGRLCFKCLRKFDWDMKRLGANKSVKGGGK